VEDREIERETYTQTHKHTLWPIVSVSVKRC
jgi:hypothetical protein